MQRVLFALIPALAWAADPTASLPKGFKPIFNGMNLDGWHISEENHHGNTRAWKVKDGVLSVTQDKPGNGGILLTDKQYKNFELYLEFMPDWGCDGGVFLRSNEKGEAYQVTIDYLEGGTVGAIYGEGLPEVNKPDTGKGDKVNRSWMSYLNRGQWNHMLVRIEGDAPRIQVWLNGTRIVDWKDSANHSAGGASSGMVALQAHQGTPGEPGARWVQGGYHRFRQVAIRELK